MKTHYKTTVTVSESGTDYKIQPKFKGEGPSLDGRPVT